MPDLKGLVQKQRDQWGEYPQNEVALNGIGPDELRVPDNGAAPGAQIGGAQDAAKRDSSVELLGGARGPPPAGGDSPPAAAGGQAAEFLNKKVAADRHVVAVDAMCAAHYCPNLVTNSKYTVLTFLPKNLYEQFHYPLNRYFLMVGLAQLWSLITPVSPFTTLIPLLMAFLITAAKDGFDDVERHKDDAKFNNREYQVVRPDDKSKGGTMLRNVRSKDIRVGDIVRITDTNEIPCDLFLISSSDPDGIAYIKTDNLDGEIDLKPRICPDELGLQREGGQHFRGTVVCSPPDSKLYSFNARLELEGRPAVGLTSATLLLQTCTLQNTDYAYGLAVYTGNETKAGCNKRRPPVKQATLDNRVGRCGIVLFCCQVILSFGLGVHGNRQRANVAPQHWYLAYQESRLYELIIIPARFFLLTSVMIPISYKVLVTISKFLVARTIGWDRHMYNPDIDAEVGGCPAKANSTELAEDLGQIEHIMTDKTGTLTENIMEFRCCSVAGRVWGGGPDAADGACDPNISALDDPVFVSNLDAGEEGLTRFARLLALCHTVSTKEARSGQHPTLVASSPDEEALVLAARNMGVSLVDKTKREVAIAGRSGAVERHEILHVFEFDSDRKMMSVLLRGPPDARGRSSVTLYSKGADDKVIAILDSAVLRDPAVAVLPEHLGTFAKAGLRTLVLGQRPVSDRELEEWLPRVQAANATTGAGREDALNRVYRDMERGLTLVGATAIEDRLQTDVPETIATLRRAGICFWMLTGDKFETAKQIARACNLWAPGEDLVEVRGNADSLPGVLHAAYRARVSPRRSRAGPGRPNAGAEVPQGGARFVAITDGSSLEHLLQEPLLPAFRDLCLSDQCASVVCCRVTPGQKALVTRMVKLATLQDSTRWQRMAGLATETRVLSIGDGGNDVSMIQEAKVGVGIIGKEGRQASRAADYSVARFHYLRPLLLVHGHHSYVRAAYITQYCFYKSMFLAFVQQLFNFTTMFSGQTFWDSFMLMMWNAVYTFPTPFFYVLDRDLSRSTLLENPELYVYTQRGDALTNRTFLGFLLRGQAQALALFLLTYWTFDDYYVFADTGGTTAMLSASTVPYGAMLLAQSWTLILESHTITGLNALGIFGMPPFFVFSLAVYGSLTKPMDFKRPVSLGVGGSYYGVHEEVLEDTMSWLALFLFTTVLMLPHTIWVHYQQIIAPTPLVAAGLPSQAGGPCKLFGGAFNIIGDDPPAGAAHARMFGRPPSEPASARSARSVRSSASPQSARQIDVRPAVSQANPLKKTAANGHAWAHPPERGTAV